MSDTLVDTYILTPLYFSRTEEIMQRSNFTLAQLVNFRRNITPYLTRIDRAWGFLVTPIQIDHSNQEEYETVQGTLTKDYTSNRYFMALTVTQAGMRIELEETMKEKLITISEFLCNNHLNHSAMIDVSKPIMYKSTIYPPFWLRDVILELLPFYPGWSFDDDILYDNQPDDSYGAAYLNLMNMFQDFYLDGYVVVKNQQKSWINSWELEKHPEYSNLMRFRWSNSLLAPDPAQLLIDLVNGVYKRKIRLPKHIYPDPKEYDIIDGGQYYNFIEIDLFSYSYCADKIKKAYN